MVVNWVRGRQREPRGELVGGGGGVWAQQLVGGLSVRAPSELARETGCL